MNLCNEIENSYILLSSNINYYDDMAYFSLHFFNEEIITIESNSLLAVHESSISLYIHNEYKVIKIDHKCKKEIQKLKTIFKEACAYEIKN